MDKNIINLKLAVVEKNARKVASVLVRMPKSAEIHSNAKK